MSDTTSSYGTGLSYGSGPMDSSGLTYTEIEKVESVTPPPITVAASEQKYLKKPDRTIGKKPGWKSTGDASAVIFYDPAEMTVLYAMAGVMRAWKVELADGGTVVFDGFISNYGVPQLNGDDEVKIEISITVDGLPDYTPGSGSEE